jgi:hypothetical protein
VGALRERRRDRDRQLVRALQARQRPEPTLGGLAERAARERTGAGQEQLARCAHLDRAALPVHEAEPRAAGHQLGLGVETLEPCERFAESAHLRSPGAAESALDVALGVAAADVERGQVEEDRRVVELQAIVAQRVARAREDGRAAQVSNGVAQRGHALVEGPFGASSIDGPERATAR